MIAIRRDLPELPARSWPRRLLAGASLAAAGAFLAVLIGRVGWRTLLGRISGADPLPLGLAFLAIVLRYVCWGVRWRELMRPVARPGPAAVQKALMASAFFNTAIPAARPFGGLVRSWYLARRLGLPVGRIYGTALADQMGYATTSMALAAISVPALFLDGGGVRNGLAAAAGLVGLICAAFLFRPARANRLVERIRSRLPAAAGPAEEMVESARFVLSRGWSWAVIAAGGVAVWCGSAVAFYFSARAIGAPIALGAAAGAWAVGSLVGLASATPGGIGTTESAAIVPLVASGVPADAALAAILLVRGFEYLFTLCVGGLCAASALRGTPARGMMVRPPPPPEGT